jgi:hypothetical protein
MITIKPEIQISGAMSSIKKLQKALTDIKDTVKDLNQALEKTAKLSGGISGTGGASNRGGGNNNIGKQAFLGDLLGGGVGGAAGRLFSSIRRNPSVSSLLIQKYASKYSNVPIVGPILGNASFESSKAAYSTYVKTGRGAESAKASGEALIKSLKGPLILAGLAVTALSAAADIAAKHLDELAKIGALGGGTSGQVNAISGLMGALGGGIGGIGKGLSNGFGPLVASKAGVSPVGGPFGDMDYNKKTLAVLKLIAKQTSFTEARRIAEMSGSPEAALIQQMSKITQNMLLNPAVSPSSSSTGAWEDLKGQMQVLWNLIKSSFSILMTPLFQFTTILLKIYNSIEGVVIKFNPITDSLKKLSDFFQYLSKLLDSWFGGGDDHKDAINKNTDAVKDLNKSINQGIYGGGPRAQSAIPNQQKQVGFYNKNSFTPYGIL